MAFLTSIPYRGGAFTLLLFLLLLTPPNELLEQRGSYADTVGDSRGLAATPIDVRSGLVSDPAGAIPRVFGEWTGTDDDSWPPELQDQLSYDSLLVRQYQRPGFYVPVQLMVITAENAHAFHNPTVCFRVQGNSVYPMQDTSIEFEGQDISIGRIVVEDVEGNSPPRIVYNLYLVQEKFAAPERTTWIRLMFSGANLTTEPQLHPFLTGLLGEIAPHAFSSRWDARTTVQAVHAIGGWPLAAAAIGLAVIPLGVEGMVLVRRRRKAAKLRAQQSMQRARPPVRPR